MQHIGARWMSSRALEARSMLSCKPRVRPARRNRSPQSQVERLLQQIVARMVQHLPIMSLCGHVVLPPLQHLKRPQLEHPI